MSAPDQTGPPESLVLHASCVALGAQAVLITGASGAGKSSLALDLMAFGCDLVADDRVIVTRDGDRIVASAPPPLSGLIEARGLGLLRAVARADVPLSFMVDLDRREDQRLPQRVEVDMLGCPLISVGRTDARSFAAAVLQMLKQGRAEPS